MSVERTPSQNVSSGGSVTGGQSSLWVGNLIWMWNRTDRSQFAATAVPHNVDPARAVGSLDAATASTLSFIADLNAEPIGTSLTNTKLGPGLKITNVSLTGGAVFEVIDPDLVLPARYVVYVNFVHSESSSMVPSVLPYYTITDEANPATTMQGAQCNRAVLSASGQFRPIVNGGHTSDSAIYPGGGSFDDQMADNGGPIDLFTCYRQTADDDPAASRILSRCFEPDGASSAGEVAIGAWKPNAEEATIGTNWDGLNMNRFAIGCWTGLVNESSDVWFSDIRIYQHPLDALLGV